MAEATFNPPAVQKNRAVQPLTPELADFYNKIGPSRHFRQFAHVGFWWKQTWLPANLICGQS